jgi:hypothetical protein
VIASDLYGLAQRANYQLEQCFMHHLEYGFPRTLLLGSSVNRVTFYTPLTLSAYFWTGFERVQHQRHTSQKKEKL